ncbi:hypothetical protein MesoLj131b_77010 (plasmid) [Mesorhizobium sp. 131-2-5]|nr:hypothetical protein MesoLj131b_77010 [Mesorhizobium sp. 131-2-5]
MVALSPNITPATLWSAVIQLDRASGEFSAFGTLFVAVRTAVTDFVPIALSPSGMSRRPTLWPNQTKNDALLLIWEK